MFKQPVGDETNRIAKQTGVSYGGHSVTAIALVSDPHVAVVIVPPCFTALGQAGGGCSHHPAARSCEASQDRVAVASVRGAGAGRQLGNGVSPGRFGCAPCFLGLNRLFWQLTCDNLEDQVVVLARGNRQVHGEVPASPVRAGTCCRCPLPTKMVGPTARGPDPAFPLNLGDGIVAIVRSGFEMHAHTGISFRRDDPSKQYRARGFSWKRERLSTFDNATVGDPTASPDQRSRSRSTPPKQSETAG